MLTPGQLLEYSQSNLMVESLSKYNYDLLLYLAEKIAQSEKYFTEAEKRIAQSGIRNDGYLGSLEWATYIKTSIDADYQKFYREADRINKKLPGWTQNFYERTGLESYIYQAGKFQEAFDAGMISQAPVKFADNPIIHRIIEAGAEVTAGELDNFTRTTAKRTNGNLQAVLTQAHLDYVTNAFSREEAIQNALRRLYGDKNNIMQVVEYPTGHKDFLDVAVRRAVIGGLNLTTSQINMDLGERLGGTTVETSAHMFARDTGSGYENHLDWQGKWYSYLGRNPDYPDFEESCGWEGRYFGKYKGKGIHGYNCRHGFAFVFPGISEHAYDPADYIAPDIEWNGKTYTGYQGAQMQRDKEGRVKSLKRKLIVHNQALESAVNDDIKLMERNNFYAKSRQLKKAEARLKEFCKETGLEYQPQRVRYFGYDRSLASKTSAANRRYQKEREK